MSSVYIPKSPSYISVNPSASKELIILSKLFKSFFFLNGIIKFDSSLKVLIHILSLSFKFSTNLITDFFVYEIDSPYIEPEISILNPISIGSLKPIPSYFDFKRTPK